MSEQMGKKVSESSIDGHVYQIFPNDLNPNNTVFGGRVMEIADMLAASCAKMHADSTCVTLLVDSLRFLSPAHRGEILVFQAAVNRTWKTSMEVGIKVVAREPGGRPPRKVVSAFFTFVAIDENNKPRGVCPVIPEFGEEKRRFEDAEKRRELRLKQSQLKEEARKKNQEH